VRQSGGMEELSKEAVSEFFVILEQ